MAGHELVGVRGSTQASIEYTGGALELITSLMGMVQRREALFSLYGIQIPPILITPVTTAAPAPAVGRKRDRLQHVAEVELGASKPRAVLQSPF
ncbi:unnamed protein product [Camellia sinensis]